MSIANFGEKTVGGKDREVKTVRFTYEGKTVEVTLISVSHGGYISIVQLEDGTTQKVLTRHLTEKGS